MATLPNMICPRCWGFGVRCGLCKGARSVPDVQLTENFQLSEFVRSGSAARKRIANDPSEKVIANLRDVAALLESIRAAFGPVLITSGYRAPDLNEEIGGSETSAHCYGLAADFNVAKASPADVLRWLRESPLAYDQGIDEPGWCHIGVRSRSGDQRKQLLVMRGGKYSPFKG